MLDLSANDFSPWSTGIVSWWEGVFKALLELLLLALPSGIDSYIETCFDYEAEVLLPFVVFRGFLWFDSPVIDDIDSFDWDRLSIP